MVGFLKILTWFDGWMYWQQNDKGDDGDGGLVA